MRDTLDQNQAYQIDLKSGRFGTSSKTLTGDITLAPEGPILHFFDPNGADRIVTLPAVREGTYLSIFNLSTSNTITVKNAGGSTIAVVYPLNTVQFYSSETAWNSFGHVFGASGAGHRVGMVTDPGAVSGTTRFLREDGQWAVPPGGGGGASDVYSTITDGTNSATAAGADTIKFRSSDGSISAVVTNNDLTHGDNVNFAVVEANVDHDALGNFVANEHIDHSTVSINTAANSGLAGGGNLTASRSLTLDINNLTADTPVLGDSFAFFDTSGSDTNKATLTTLNGILDHNALLNYVANQHVDHTTVSISAGTGLTGGGTIAASRTISLDINGLTADTLASGDFFVFYDISGSDHNKITFANLNASLDHNALLNYVANQHIDHTTVSISAGTGLTGGGTIAANRTLSVDFATTTETLTGTSVADVLNPDCLAALWEKGADIASAGTISIGEGGYFHVTGTTTITDIDWATAKDGRAAILVFDGTLTLTHNATTLILPTGASITTAAGDTCCVVQDNADNVKVVWYQRASGAALAGGAGSGDVVGPGSSTDNAVVRFDGATGKLIQNSNAILSDAGDLSLTTTAGGTLLSLTSSDAGGTEGPSIDMSRASASPANNDVLSGLNFYGRDTGGNVTLYANINAQIVDVTDTSEDGRLNFGVMKAGTFTSMVKLDTSFSPVTNDQLALGTSSLGFSDLFLADGGVVNWANGSARFIHSSAAGARRVEYNVTTTEADISLGLTGTHTFSTVTTGYGILNQLGATFNTGSGGSTWRQYYSQSLINIQSSVAAGSHYANQVQCGTFGSAPTGSITEQVVFYCDQMTGQHSGSAALTISSNMGLRVANQSAASGGSGTITISNSYGVKVDDQGTGASNYAIYTGVGVNHFGDKTIVSKTGTSALATQVQNNARTPLFQVQGVDADTTGILQARFDATASPPVLHFAKSRNTTVGSHTVVNGGDTLGYISFAGSDGTNFAEAAFISCTADNTYGGSPGANDMPGLLAFATSADGAEAPTTRMTIDCKGHTLLAVNGATSGGVVPGIFICRLEADYTLTSNTNVQKLFNASTNGALTLQPGSYIFRAMIGVTTMNASSGNAAFSIIGAGTATLGNIQQGTVGVDLAQATTAAAAGASWSVTADQPAANAGAINAVLATTATAMWVFWTGSFKVTAAGTIIPSIDLTTANAAVVKAGSYFEVFRMGDETTATIGPWS